MKNYDGIIFDVDGTLVQTHDLIFASFKHVAEKYLNKKITNEEIHSLFGPTEDVILKDWAQHRYDDARNDYYGYYESNHGEMASAFPGLPELVHLIKSKGIKLGIYTGKGRESTIITLKAVGMLEDFDLIITGDDVDKPKPSPEGINLFMEKFGLDKSRVLMVGDAHVDILAADAAGVKSASVLWDSLTAEKVKQLKPDYLFDDVVEFIEFIKENI